MTDPTEGESLDARLDRLLVDAEEEAGEAKAEFEAAKTRHEAARGRVKALRTAQEQVRGANARPPDETNGESVDDDHMSRVREAREDAA